MGGSILVVVLLLILNACGGTQGGGQPPAPPLSIAITILSPDFVVAGSGSTSLFVNGSGFTQSSIVQWNGSALPTTFGTSQILTATIAGSLVAQPGTARITVKDGSASSNSLLFGIASPAAAAAGVVAIITVAPDGTPANGDSLVLPSISATGRYVAFQSAATNLVQGSASGFQEIYERDTCIGVSQACTPSTIRVTVTYDGSPVNGHSRFSAISADGRYVAFDSSATNILPNSSICAASAGFSCVFLRDTCTSAPPGCVPATSAISADINSNIQSGGLSTMSPDGRFVAFGSKAANLIAGGTTNGFGNALVRDTCNGAPPGCAPTTVLVSVSSSGTEGNQDTAGQAISPTARYIAFASYATNLVANDTNIGQGDYFWRDTCRGLSGSCNTSTVRVDVSNGGMQANGHIFDVSPSISSNGRFVGFCTNATNLVSQNVQGWGQCYVRDTCTGAAGCTPGTSLVSLGNDGSIPNNPSDSEVMTPNGRFFAFDSLASNLVPDDGFSAGAFKDIFVRDTCFGVASGCTPSTVRVSVANFPNPQTPGDSPSSSPAISADGHYVLFLSSATNLAPGITGNGLAMVYLAKTGF